MITVKGDAKKMQELITDWLGEIDKIAGLSIKRSKAILETFEENNLEAETKDDNSDSN